MPGLTIATGAPTASTSATTTNPRRGSSSSARASSPPRPPISPITPTLGPAHAPGSGATGPPTATTSTKNNTNTIPDFALGRPVYTHTTQTNQVGIAPPPAQPIDFDSNPDVLALKNAITILQLQKARATADIQSLNRAKEAALANPEAFIVDLTTGRVRVEGDPLLSGARVGGQANDETDTDTDSASSSDEDDATSQPPRHTISNGDPLIANAKTTSLRNGAPPSPRSKHRLPQKPTGKPHPSPSDTLSSKTTNTQPPPWQSLPKPQTIVRCPPINWSQYGVVGSSLDKLHAEQLAAPTPGQPVVLGPGGTYEFRAGSGEPGSSSPFAVAGAGGSPTVGAGGEQQPQRLVGVAAPYNPLRDKLEKKGKKAGKR
ncbi:hypothetical protein VTI74DRAFT_10914 [Chaetomium olivicolor]